MRPARHELSFALSFEVDHANRLPLALARALWAGVRAFPRVWDIAPDPKGQLAVVGKLTCAVSFAGLAVDSHDTQEAQWFIARIPF